MKKIHKDSVIEKTKSLNRFIVLTYILGWSVVGILATIQDRTVAIVFSVWSVYMVARELWK